MSTTLVIGNLQAFRDWKKQQLPERTKAARFVSSEASLVGYGYGPNTHVVLVSGYSKQLKLVNLARARGYTLMRELT